MHCVKFLSLTCRGFLGWSGAPACRAHIVLKEMPSPPVRSTDFCISNILLSYHLRVSLNGVPSLKSKKYTQPLVLNTNFNCVRSNKRKKKHNSGYHASWDLLLPLCFLEHRPRTGLRIFRAEDVCKSAATPQDWQAREIARACILTQSTVVELIWAKTALLEAMVFFFGLCSNPLPK